MRRWIVVTAVALVAAVPAAGYAQNPSGDKMKDDKMKMEQGDKMEKKGDKMMKDKMMDKKDSKMMHDKSKDKMMEKKDDKMDKK
ncbi:MAG TPA: hypothetical protein VJX92_29485 [Methylomirabilota bacterium]|nr:hypothetical protein [Methylomirabilota bacterium]